MCDNLLSQNAKILLMSARAGHNHRESIQHVL